MATDVNGVIEAAQSTAREMAEKAGNMVDNAMRAFDFRMVPGGMGMPISFTDARMETGEVPIYSGARFEPPPEPEQLPALTPIPGYVAPAPADRYLLADMPGPGEFQTPGEVPALSAAPPSINDVEIPPEPAALADVTIDPPQLRDFTIPGVPDVALPGFDVERPDTYIDAPGDFVAQYRLDFADQGHSLRASLEGSIDGYLAKINPRFAEQMAALEDKLAKYAEGGTALSPSVESAIWARAADRTNADYLRARDTAYADSAARGFTMPGGAVLSAVTQARQAAADANARASLDIAIRQAEMEQQNVQFALTQSANLRQLVLGAAQQWAGTLVQLNGQALQFASGVMQATIELYGMKIKIVQARIEVYRTEAQVYEYRLKAALSAYDAYRAHIDAIKAGVEVDAARVQAFVAKMNSYAAIANVYRARLDGVTAKASIEKIKADLFGAQVQGYAAQVQGYSAAWAGYRARVEGKSAEWQAYGHKVQAFSAQVDAQRSEIQARLAEIEATAKTNAAVASAYSSRVDGYEALVRGKSAAVQAEVMSFDSTIKAYSAGVHAQEAKARVDLANTEGKSRVAISSYEAESRTFLAAAQMEYKRMTDVAAVATAGAKVHGDMASSALAGMNALASASETRSL